MKLSISSACSGHGRCYTLAPELAVEDDEGYGQVSVDEVPPELARKAQTIVDACPERAITLD